MKIEISSLLRPFFAAPETRYGPDNRSADPANTTFVFSGYRWGTQEAKDKALKELRTFANWANIRFSEAGNDSTIMSLPFPVEEVKAFCDQQALNYQIARLLPPMDDGDLSGYATIQSDGSVRIEIERATAADSARSLLSSKNWAKDDDFVSAVLRGVICRGGSRPIQVYIRLMGDVPVAVYDCARDNIIRFGIEPAEMVA